MRAANISNCAAGKSPEAPAPAKPTKCSLPIFEAKSDAPIANHPKLRPPKKYSLLEASSPFFFGAKKT